MRHALISVVLLLTAAQALSQQQTEPARTGRIEGRLCTMDGQVCHSGCATVFICDAATGLPLIADTAGAHQPFGTVQFRGGLDELWHSDTSEDGAFVFEAVPPGEYRLVAQSWAGVSGVPQGQGKTSQTIILHGAAEHVTVSADQTTKAYLRKLGDGVLNVVNDPKEAGAYLLVSTEPPLGDAILGPWGWGESFVKHVIAVTHMSKPRLTIVGLPNDQTVHLAAFFYDNSPGTAAADTRIGQDRDAVLKIYAGWSNGHDDPPPALLPLVEHMEQNSSAATELFQQPPFDALTDEQNQRHGPGAWMQLIAEHGNDPVNVPQVGEFRVKDVLAAESYRMLREHHRARQERSQ